MARPTKIGKVKSHSSSPALKQHRSTQKGTESGFKITKIEKHLSQGSSKARIRVASPEAGKPEWVTYLSQSHESVVGKKIAKKIRSHAFKVSQQLERKGYALAVLPVQATTVKDLVGVIDNEEPATDGQDDPYEVGRKAVDALKEAEGGHIDRNEAARLLDIGLPQLYNRIDQKKMVTWVDAAGRYHFPGWQFDVNGLLPGVAECLQLLRQTDEWAVMRFFLTRTLPDRPSKLLRLSRAVSLDVGR